jgi:hypothetical protein
MKAKILLTAIALLALVVATALAATGSNVNQNIDQSANQVIGGLAINNSTINQSIMQNANQNIQGTGLGGNVNADQNIGQSAGQSIQGSNIRDSTVSQGIMQGAAQNIAGTETGANASLSQSIIQGANQSFFWNSQNYFTMNNQTITMTADQRSLLMTRTEDFLASYPSNRMFIMPLADLNAFNAAGRTDVVVLNAGFGTIPTMFSALPVINIPLNQLPARIGEIPTGSTIAVISDNDMISATAATLLRMQGYNAWAVNTGVC